MSEKNLTISNPELKAKMEALRMKESHELEEEIYTEVANSARFLSVVTLKEDSTPENPKFDLPVLTTAGHGLLFYPVFTDMEELRKWNSDENAQVAVLTFDDYAEMVLRDSKVQGIVVNPRTTNFPIERDMIDYLRTQKSFFGKLAIEQMFQQEKGGPAFSEPSPYPTAMAEAVRAAMTEAVGIRRAWLRLMENEGEKSYLIVIDAEGGEAERCYGPVSSAALPHFDGLYLDLISFEDDLGKRAADGVEPFYCK